ncbi:MAG: creatininase family protein [Alphaproteobacteria bacterium]|nr:creatininase family protein [Alphaproteobacteria bacterium]
MTEVEWGRMKASEIAALAARDAVVIVPVGSIEQHGPHLPTQVDALLSGEVSRRAARKAAARIPVIVAPTVWSGLAEHHMTLGGTLSLDFATFFGLLRCVCRSLVRHGFRRILLLNGHGGNITALNVAVNELAVELQIPLATTSYWLLAKEEFAAILERQTTVRHACEAETSMLLALAPDLVDMARAGDIVGPTEREIAEVAGTDAVHRWRSFKARTSHGVIGDPRSATAAKGERLLEAAADSVSVLCQNAAFWSLPA